MGHALLDAAVVLHPRWKGMATTTVVSYGSIPLPNRVLPALPTPCFSPSPTTVHSYRSLSVNAFPSKTTLPTTPSELTRSSERPSETNINEHHPIIFHPSDGHRWRPTTTASTYSDVLSTAYNRAQHNKFMRTVRLYMKAAFGHLPFTRSSHIKILPYPLNMHTQRNRKTPHTDTSEQR